MSLTFLSGLLAGIALGVLAATVAFEWAGRRVRRVVARDARSEPPAATGQSSAA